MDTKRLKWLAGIMLIENLTLQQEQALVDQLKEQIDPLFDTESGRELLLDLAEFISTNVNSPDL